MNIINRIIWLFWSKSKRDESIQKAKETLASEDGMSKEQLRYYLVHGLNFSSEDASKAVEKCGANWKEEAYKHGLWLEEQYEDENLTYKKLTKKSKEAYLLLLS